jgi:(1->4)-alpha-D-glucan 1-alpha-D-glucosylmutase
LLVETRRETRIVAETLALAISRNVRRGRTTEELREFLDEISSRPGLAWVVIFDPGGRVLMTRSTPGSPPTRFDDAARGVRREKVAISEELAVAERHHHARLNPELGTPEDFEGLLDALAVRGLSLIVDVVPNHMGIGAAANAWWDDVLEHGMSSPYAGHFDIDWWPVNPELEGKILLPILGDQYGRVLENQELQLRLDGRSFRVCYQAVALPVNPRSIRPVLEHRRGELSGVLGERSRDLQEYRSILTAIGHLPAAIETDEGRIREGLREKEVVGRRLSALVESCPAVRESIEETLRVFNGKLGDPQSFELLDHLLAEQSYRLAHWRVAADDINYRRFFDVNELAALRMENPAVFAETHRLLFDLVRAGKVAGLRIDHPDGT